MNGGSPMAFCLRSTYALVALYLLTGCAPDAQTIKEAEARIDRAEQRSLAADTREQKAIAELVGLQAEQKRAKARLEKALKIEQSHRALAQGQIQKASKLKAQSEALGEELFHRQYIYRARKAEQAEANKEVEEQARVQAQAASQEERRIANFARETTKAANAGKKFYVESVDAGTLYVKRVLPGGDVEYTDLGVPKAIQNLDGSWGHLSVLRPGDSISVSDVDGSRRVWILAR